MRPRVSGGIDLQAIGGKIHHTGLELDQKRATKGQDRRVLVDEFVAQPAATLRLVVVGPRQMDADLTEAREERFAARPFAQERHEESL